MNPILSFLVGTWFICCTNFPIWLKGNKTNPVFNYAAVGEDKLSDKVNYLKNGKQRSIKGYDVQKKGDSIFFNWHGKGFLRPLKSKWKIALMDSAGQWAVIFFSKTVFTTEGVDIISRDRDLPAATIENIKAQLLKDPELMKHVSSLKNLYH